MRTNFFPIFKSILTMFFLSVSVSSLAQIKYTSQGKLTVGNVTPYSFYPTTYWGSIYLKDNQSNFLQFDITPAAPRIAGHGDEVVFYNTQTSTFNSIQVKNVYNYSDARAKTNIRPLTNSLGKLKLLRTYSYKFREDTSMPTTRAFIKGGNANEYGMLAQEVEKVLPELVITDSEGKKLINYTELIPMLVNAVQNLSSEVEKLKAKVK